jgi:hypothetical protein
MQVLSYTGEEEAGKQEGCVRETLTLKGTG